MLLSEEYNVIIEPENIELDIRYEDDDILVINKPKNMITHPTTKETTGSLVNALLYKYGYEGLSDINGVMRPGIVHRLDRNTSGLLMVAKNFSSNQSFLNDHKLIVHGYLLSIFLSTNRENDSQFHQVQLYKILHEYVPWPIQYRQK